MTDQRAGEGEQDWIDHGSVRHVPDFPADQCPVCSKASRHAATPKPRSDVSSQPQPVSQQRLGPERAAR